MTLSLNADDMLDKRNNEKVLNSLLFLNSLYEGETPAISNESKTQIYNLLLEYDNPLEVARLMVLSNYMIREVDSENSISNIFFCIDRGLWNAALKELKKPSEFYRSYVIYRKIN